MKLSKFKTFYSFDKWFHNSRKIYNDFIFIWFNYEYLEGKEPLLMYRLIERNRTVAIAILQDCGYGQYEILLFETKEGCFYCGYGKELLNRLIIELKPKYLTLDYADKESKLFWKHMGFRVVKNTLCGMERKIKRKELKDKIDAFKEIVSLPK